MLFLILCFSIFLILYLSYKKKRISPLNPDKYLISPIDGYVSNIQTTNIDDVLFTEITLNFFLFSDRNLFAPIRGEVSIKELSQEKIILSIAKQRPNIQIENSILSIQNSKNIIEIFHYSDNILSNFNFFSSSFLSLYEQESWTPSINYGFMLYGSQIKILFHASHELVVDNHQSVIGGESILAIFNCN